MISIPLVLAVPWGLCTQTPLAGLEIRRNLNHNETIEIDGRHGALLAVPADSAVRFTGRRWREQPEGIVFPWFGRDFRLSALPTAALSSEQQISIEIHVDQQPINANLQLHSHLLRPRPGTQDQETAAIPGLLKRSFQSMYYKR